MGIRERIPALCFMQVAFLAGGQLLLQFREQISTVTKKDFVPYSERRAAERQLLKERLEVRLPEPSPSCTARGPADMLQGCYIKACVKRSYRIPDCLMHGVRVHTAAVAYVCGPAHKHNLMRL
jgi:hypothetical protein